MENKTLDTLTLRPVFTELVDVRDIPGTNEERYVFEPIVGDYSQPRKVRRLFRFGTVAFISVFTVIGVLFTGVFIAMQFGLLNVRGSNATRNEFYSALPKSTVYAASVPKKATANSCVQQGSTGQAVPVCAWNQSDEWLTVRSGLVKDKTVITKASEQTGVPARMIAATVSPEQLRFFSSNREAFKRYFEPLKILGSMTQFSLGVAGFKQKTAETIEQYTVDHNSPFFAGAGMASLVAYPAGTNRGKALYDRLTDTNDHYYSYLYTALFIKELEAQWSKGGYDISQRPDVVTTLFNIGFNFSHPKANPEIGGTSITLKGVKYSYGELGTDFYRSDELTSIFPQV